MARTTPSSSLTGKLLFWATLITAATLIAVVWASTNVAQRVLQRQIQRRAEAAAEDVALDLITAQNPARLVNSRVWVEKLRWRLSQESGLLGIRIEVTWRGDPAHVEVAYADPHRPTLIAFEEVPLGHLLTRVSDDQLEVVMRQELRHGDLAIRVVTSTEVIRAFLDVIGRNATWMGVAAWLVLVLTIAVMIHRTITRPLRRVASALGAVASGKLGEQVEDVRTAEIAPLVRAFNRMSRRLWNTENERTQLLEEVEALNLDLKVRVEDATAALADAHADLARRDRLAALGELVGTIAHEVGTPLNSVLAHLDLLAEDLPEDTDRQRLEIAVKEIERVSEIIRRHLRSTRAPTPRRQPVDVESLLRESIRVFEARAASNGKRLIVESDPGTFETDPDLLAQIVHNLVSNGLKAVGTGGTVMVCGEVGAERLRVEVRDDGTGMDAATQRRAFEPFFSDRNDGSGTGLGLSIVRNAVVSLGGQIQIDSQPGRGTSVVVELGGEGEVSRTDHTNHPAPLPAWRSDQ